MKRLVFSCASAGAVFAGLAFGGEPAAVSAPDVAGETVPLERPERDRDLRVWAGPARRFGSSIKARWNSAKVASFLPAAYSRSASLGSLDAPTDYVDRDYEDGFVHVDEGTTDPMTEIYGTTWNWGYDEPSQYDGATITYRTGTAGTESRFRRESVADGLHEPGDFDQTGFELGAFWSVADVLRGDLSLEVSARFYGDEEEKFSDGGVFGRSSSTSWEVVDIYDAQWPDVPAAPYAGDWEGPGYVIDQTPMAREKRKTGSSSSKWTASSTGSAELELWDLRIGPSMQWALCRYVEVGVAAQLLAGRVSLDVKSQTSVHDGSRLAVSSAESSSEDQWIWGASATAAATATLPCGFFASASGSYDWWDGRVEASAGPYDVSADLGRWSLSLRFGKDF